MSPACDFRRNSSVSSVEGRPHPNPKAKAHAMAHANAARTTMLRRHVYCYRDIVAATVGAGDGLAASAVNGGNGQPLANEWGHVSGVYYS